VSPSGFLLALSLAIAPNESIDVRLVGGAEISGRVSRIQSDGVEVTTDVGRSFVSLQLVESVVLQARTLDQAGLSKEIADRLRYEVVRLPRDGHTSNPFLVSAASFVLPGAGEAMLGDWPQARGLFVADLLVLGLGSYLWFVQKDRPAAVPLFGLDLIFRMTSANQVFRSSSRRRALSRESDEINTGILR
jgi:hypothetical protein